MSCSLLLWLYPGDLRRTLRPLCSGSIRQLSHSYRMTRSLRESYRLLQLSENVDASQAQVKEAYLRMAKLYHPDSGAPTADPAIFSQIEEAYRVVLAHLARQQAASRQARLEEEDEEDENDGNKAKRQAPQHRQYLSYDGVGSGTPSQRERQYRQFRVDRATDQVLEYRKRGLERAAVAEGEDSLATRDMRRRSQKIKVTQAVERLVEDLIQESMARGDFHNLSGSGKPLSKFDHNPYADPMTHNLNRILIDNGYQPQWIVAHKDIREKIDRLRVGLLASRARLGDPMTAAEQAEWQQCCQDFSKDLARLNKKVDGFNLIVPLLSRQMVHFSLQRELDRALKGDWEMRLEKQKEKENLEEERRTRNTPSQETNGGLFSWVQKFLK